MRPTPTRVAGGMMVALAMIAGASGCGRATRDSNHSVAQVERDQSPLQADLTGTLLDPSPPRPTETLRDTRGHDFSLATRPNTELTILYFGYTHCPDLCPTTMADLAVAWAQLPAAVRERVKVAFVTEDPKRDTPRLVWSPFSAHAAFHWSRATWLT